jgi:hypothetical protein
MRPDEDTVRLADAEAFLRRVMNKLAWMYRYVAYLEEEIAKMALKHYGLTREQVEERLSDGFDRQEVEHGHREQANDGPV